MDFLLRNLTIIDKFKVKISVVRYWPVHTGLRGELHCPLRHLRVVLPTRAKLGWQEKVPVQEAASPAPSTSPLARLGTSHSAEIQHGHQQLKQFYIELKIRPYSYSAPAKTFGKLFAAAWQRWELQCFVADLCAITNYFYCDPVLFTSTPSCRRSHVLDRALFIFSTLHWWDKCWSYILHDRWSLTVVKVESVLQLWSFMLGPNIGSRPVRSSGSGSDFAVLSLNNLSSLAAAVFTEEAAIRQYHLSGPGRGIPASKIVLFYSILCTSIGKLEN